MFKKVLSFALASSMAMSIAANAMAAISSPIYAIESNSYGYSKDLGAVDLNEKNPAFSYGDTVYYPLLSASGAQANDKVTEAQNALTAANEALKAAADALNLSEETLKEKEAAVKLAEEKLTKAEAVAAAAADWKNSVDGVLGDEDEKKAAYVEALKAYDSQAAEASGADEADTKAKEEVEAVTNALDSFKGDRDSASSDRDTRLADVKTKEEAVKEKQQILNDALKNSEKYVSSTDDVKGIKIKSNWDLNGNAVEKVELVKKKAAAPFELTNKYIYFLTVGLKDSLATGETDISGTVSMKKTGSFDYEDMKLDVNLTVGYPAAQDNVIGKNPLIFSEGNGLSGDYEDELRFEFDDNAYFTVDTMGQGKILLAADNEFDANIAMIYNAANLDFFNGNGASFNKLGTLAIPAAEGSHLYKVEKDGKLTKIAAPYDKDEEAFMVRTRTLGRYVISDVDLKIAEVKPSSPNGTVNPQTGANI